MIVNNTTKNPIFASIPVNRLLLPGNNEIPTKEYAELRPHISEMLELKELVEVNGVVTVSEKDGVTTVDTSKVKEYEKLAAEEKKALIKDTVNLVTLDTWLERESDSSVRLVLEKKIDQIKNYKGPGDEK